MIGRHIAPVHEAVFAGCVVIGDLDLKRMPSGGSDDLERIKVACSGWDAGGRGKEEDESQRRPKSNLHLGRTAIVIASDRASNDARPPGRAMAKQSRGT